MPEDTNNRWRLLYNNETIDYYLEQKLNQALPPKHWEVINAARTRLPTKVRNWRK